MPKLLLTQANGKQRSADLVPAAANRQLNEIQTRELDQVNRRLPSNILADMAARGLAIPPREVERLLSRLKAAADLEITIGD